MNRFTKDMATIDDMLPLLMFDFVQVCEYFSQKHLIDGEMGFCLVQGCSVLLLVICHSASSVSTRVGRFAQQNQPVVVMVNRSGG